MRRHLCSLRAHTEEPCVQVPARTATLPREKLREHRYTAPKNSKTYKDERQQLEGNNADVTTFKSDNVTHKLMQNPPKVPKPYVPPEGHMRCTSTYAQDNPIQAVEKHIACKVEEYHPPTAKMVFQSVYKDDFRAWNAHKLQPYRLCDNLKVNEGKFEMTTTSKDAYCHKNPVKVTDNFKPVPQMRESLPFDSITNYRSQYVTHPVQPRKPREKPLYHPNSAPLSRVFTSHQDYKGLPTEPVKSFKPKVAWERNPAAFDGTSEFGDKFKTWPLGPKFHHKAEEYSPPQVRMLFLSTTHGDYTAQECQRPKSARPPVQAWMKDKEPFQARSTMKEDYKAWGTVRRSPIVHKEELERPKEAFEYTTTSRSEYTPKTAQRAVSCKPTPKPLSPKPMLDETTVYRSSYTAKEIPRCPVRNGPPPGFEYNSVGVDGHRLYRTISAETGTTRPDSGIGDKPSQPHQRIPCMVSSRTKRAS
uniref:stabilizer of axonemal microtubules 2-like n=1 Tax=Centroberyx gerrardi TaxID=166262 RepID=UPI003AACA7DD